MARLAKESALFEALHSSLERIKVTKRICRALARKPQLRTSIEVGYIQEETERLALMAREGPGVHRDLCHVARLVSLKEMESLKLPWSPSSDTMNVVSGGGAGSGATSNGRGLLYIYVLQGKIQLRSRRREAFAPRLMPRNAALNDGGSGNATAAVAAAGASSGSGGGTGWGTPADRGSGIGGVGGGGLENVTEQEMLALFKHIDADGSGAITVSELQVAMEMMGVHKSQEDVAEMMDGVDADGSGEMEFNEFKNVLRQAIRARNGIPTFTEWKELGGGVWFRDLNSGCWTGEAALLDPDPLPQEGMLLALETSDLLVLERGDYDHIVENGFDGELKAKIALLRSSSILVETLKRTDFRRLAYAMRRRTVPMSTPVHEQGRPPTSVDLILEGHCKLVVRVACANPSSTSITTAAAAAAATASTAAAATNADTLTSSTTIFTSTSTSTSTSIPNRSNASYSTQLLQAPRQPQQQPEEPHSGPTDPADPNEQVFTIPALGPIYGGAAVLMVRDGKHPHLTRAGRKKRLELAVLGPGDMCSEAGILGEERQPHSCIVTSSAGLVTLSLSLRDLRKLVHPADLTALRECCRTRAAQRESRLAVATSVANLSPAEVVRHFSLRKRLSGLSTAATASAIAAGEEEEEEEEEEGPAQGLAGPHRSQHQHKKGGERRQRQCGGPKKELMRWELKDMGTPDAGIGSKQGKRRPTAATAAATIRKLPCGHVVNSGAVGGVMLSVVGAGGDGPKVSKRESPRPGTTDETLHRVATMMRSKTRTRCDIRVSDTGGAVLSTPLPTQLSSAAAAVILRKRSSGTSGLLVSGGASSFLLRRQSLDEQLMLDATAAATPLLSSRGLTACSRDGSLSPCRSRTSLTTQGAGGSGSDGVTPWGADPPLLATSTGSLSSASGSTAAAAPDGVPSLGSIIAAINAPSVASRSGGRVIDRMSAATTAAAATTDRVSSREGGDVRPPAVVTAAATTKVSSGGIGIAQVASASLLAAGSGKPLIQGLVMYPPSDGSRMQPPGRMLSEMAAVWEEKEEEEAEAAVARAEQEGAAAGAISRSVSTHQRSSMTAATGQKNHRRHQEQTTITAIAANGRHESQQLQLHQSRRSYTHRAAQAVLEARGSSMGMWEAASPRPRSPGSAMVTSKSPRPGPGPGPAPGQENAHARADANLDASRRSSSLMSPQAGGSGSGPSVSRPGEGTANAKGLSSHGSGSIAEGYRLLASDLQPLPPPIQLGPGGGAGGSCLRRPFRTRTASGAGEEEASTSPGDSGRSSSRSSNSRAGSGGSAGNASCSNSDCSSGGGGDGGSALVPYDSSSSAASHAAASHDEAETAPPPARATVGLAAEMFGGRAGDNGDGDAIIAFSPNIILAATPPPSPSPSALCGASQPHPPFERPPTLAQQHQQPHLQYHNQAAQKPQQRQQSSSSQSLSHKPMDSLSQFGSPTSPLRVGSPPPQLKSRPLMPPLSLPPAPQHHQQLQQQQLQQQQRQQQPQLAYHPAQPEGPVRGSLRSRGQPHNMSDTLGRGVDFTSTPPASPQSAQPPPQPQLFKRRSSGQVSITGPEGTTDDDWDAPLVPYIPAVAPSDMLPYQGMPLERGASAPGCNGGAGGATATLQRPRAPTAPPVLALGPRRPEIPKLGLHRLRGGGGSGAADEVTAEAAEGAPWAPVSGSQSARADWASGCASRGDSEGRVLTARADWSGSGMKTSPGSALTTRGEIVKSVKSLLCGWKTVRAAYGGGYGCGTVNGGDNPQGVAMAAAAAAGTLPVRPSRAEGRISETAAVAAKCWQRDTVAAAMALAGGERGRLAAIYSGMLRHGEAAARPALEYSLLLKQQQQQPQVGEVVMEEDQRLWRQQQQPQQAPIALGAEKSDPSFRSASKGPASPHAFAPSAAITGPTPIPVVPSNFRGSGVGMSAWNNSRAAAVAREVMPRSPGRDLRTSRR